jgi:mannose-6-phosphate isomerase-like protein (cupin superfamily)
LNDFYNERDWGNWLVLAQQPGYKVKKIKIKPGGAISKQLHYHREEYWVVFSGEGLLLLNDINITITRGSFHKIYKEDVHKVTNTGSEVLIILEIQMGDPCEEEDIVRLD